MPKTNKASFMCPLLAQACHFVVRYVNDKAKLLFTDTGSLTCEIETKDIYQDFWSDKDKIR